MNAAAADPVPPNRYFQLTGAGPSGIAIIEIRGPRCLEFMARHVRARTARAASTWQAGEVLRATLVDAVGAVLDEVLLAVIAQTPSSVFQLHLHGSPWIVRTCGELLARVGFDPSLPDAAANAQWSGSDLLEAEAHFLLPRIQTLAGARWLLAQPALLQSRVSELLRQDELSRVAAECALLLQRAGIVEWFTRAVRVAIVGPPNAGKSTLANALADRPVSLVSSQPGTTRDWVDAVGEFRGYPVLWRDTAGMRAAADDIEAEGIRRTFSVMQDADAVVLVLDGSRILPGEIRKLTAGLSGGGPACVALNKCDLGAPGDIREELSSAWSGRAASVSASERRGLDELLVVLEAALGRSGATLQLAAPFTPRQCDRLQEAATSRDLEEARKSLRAIVVSQ